MASLCTLLYVHNSSNDLMHEYVLEFAREIALKLEMGFPLFPFLLQRDVSS